MLSPKNRDTVISLMEHKNCVAAAGTLVVYPDNKETVSRLLKFSNRFGMRVIVIGSGSTFSKDFTPPENTFYISTQKFSNVIELDKSNGFITMEAGCSWMSVFGELAKDEIFFPLDISTVGKDRTAGGIFSSIDPYSAVSNYFTGLEFFSSDGTEIKYGCKTLKNVSGYDLIKFMAGSNGSFGLIYSLTLKYLTSEKSFFRFEDLNEISLERKKYSGDLLYSALKRELDVNTVFV
jgi:glycolate oxidase